MHIIQHTTRKRIAKACIDHYSMFEACILYIIDNSTTQDNIIL